MFNYSDQNKNQDSPENVQNQSRDSTTTIHLRKFNIEEKQEWIQRRERLHHLIGLDRIDFNPTKKKPTVESMLKTQRENFGITMPVLGQYVRKYMQHRPKSTFDQIQIHGGKVRKCFLNKTSDAIIYLYRQ
jgi:hypothetical protein